MQVDLTCEHLTLAEAARRFPGRPSLCTIWRWRNVGVRGVKLETLRVGGRLFTTPQAIEAFISATSGQPVVSVNEVRRHADRQRAIEAELDAAGL